MRRLLLRVSTLALLGLASWILVASLLPSKLGITKTNFDRIEEGMAAKDVRAILGPDGWHTKRPVVVLFDRTMFRRWWIEDDAIITIEFAPEEWTPTEPPFEDWQVTHKEYNELPPETLIDRLRRRLP
jgi:hypothetical protein